MIEIFARYSAGIVAHDAVGFSAARAALEVTSGRPGARHHRIDLMLGRRTLGRITFSRRHPFEDREARALEAMAADLAHPLDHALLYREARRAAARDPLTGAANRAHLEHTLEREVSLARRHGSALSLLMIDVDRFKHINDRFGHPVGDRSLAAIAACIVGRVRASDLLSRYGGEEFCVLLPRTGAGGAERLAERVRAAVEALRIPAGAETIRVTVSLGVASLAPADTAAELIAKADAALYRAKRRGRNRVSASATSTGRPAPPPRDEGDSGPGFRDWF